MGAKEAKEIAPVVVSSLPAIISAFQSTVASYKNEKEDKKISEALERVERDRDNINLLMQNQAQLARTLEGLTLLMNRLDENGGGGGRNRIRGAENNGRIRIEMNLPEDPGERDEAIEEFWRVLGNHATSQLAHNGQERVLAIEPRFQIGGRVHRENADLAASAPPIPSHESLCGSSSPHLCCDICTNRYDTEGRRPLLLPTCGHTFCKDCLHKANRRSRQCPTCRKESNVNVDNHPTNYSILDFMKEEEENDFKLKGKEGGLVNETLNAVYEDDLSRALALSLRDTHEDNDRLLAERLQEEERRIGRFAHHGDVALKVRNLEDERSERNRPQYSNDFERSERSRTGHSNDYERSERSRSLCSNDFERSESNHTEYSNDLERSKRSHPEYSNDLERFERNRPDYSNDPERSEENRPEYSNGFERSNRNHTEYSNDLESSKRMCPEDKCRRPEREDYWRRLGNGRSIQDTSSAKTISDDEDDDHRAIKRSSSSQNYGDARRILDDIKNCSDSEDDCCKSRAVPESNGHHMDTERGGASSAIFQREESQETASSGPLRLFDMERNGMLDRAQRTHELDKAERRKRKALKEQEELDLAIALSMSLQEQKG